MYGTGDGSEADPALPATPKVAEVPRVVAAAASLLALVVGGVVGLMLGGSGSHSGGCECSDSLGATAGGVQMSPDVGDRPQGWLVERLFHAEPIRCPWLNDTSLPDEACRRRVAELTAMRSQLSTCEDPLATNDRTIGHRGAALVAPEETIASFEIAAQSGASWVECDASITRDLVFVCRHGTCDLATTTDIVANHPELHARCTAPFVPGSGVGAKCCTYDFTAAELAQLCSVMDATVNTSAETTAGYHSGAPAFRSSGISEARCHDIVTLAEHLAWLKTKRLDAIPELKDTQTDGVTGFLQTQGRDWLFLADEFAGQVAAAGFTAAWDADTSQRGSRALLQTFDHR